MAIVAIFSLVFIYGASFAIRITHGFSKTAEMPEISIRLQVLNGCGLAGVASQMARKIPAIVKMPLEVTILEVGDFDSYGVKKTFVISRDKDVSQSKAFAEQLGIKEEVLYRPLQDNYRSLTTTLVIGEDYQMLLETANQEK